jgi:hypothetical protein
MKSKEDKQLKIISKEKIMTKICKERGWNINELTTGQMLFILNHPQVKSLLKHP